MNSAKWHSLILDSDYTGEIHARLGVAEWLDCKITRMTIAEAEAIVGNHHSVPFQRTPDLLIAGTGEDTTELALQLARTVGNPLTVFLASILPDQLDPLILDYDLISAPPHPQLRGENVLSLLGVPHRFRPKNQINKQVAKTPKLTLLLGGNTRFCEGFTPAYAERLGIRLLEQAQIWNGKFRISNSRRTSKEALSVIRNILSEVEEEFVDCENKNTKSYTDLLEQSDVIFCTGDSLSMCCESAITGKPVLVTTDPEAMEIYHLETLQRLIRNGHALEFNRIYDEVPSPTKILDPTQCVGQKISDLLRKRKQPTP